VSEYRRQALIYISAAGTCSCLSELNRFHLLPLPSRTLERPPEALFFCETSQIRYLRGHLVRDTTSNARLLPLLQSAGARTARPVLILTSSQPDSAEEPNPPLLSGWKRPHHAGHAREGILLPRHSPRLTSQGCVTVLRELEGAAGSLAQLVRLTCQ